MDFPLEQLVAGARALMRNGLGVMDSDKFVGFVCDESTIELGSYFEKGIAPSRLIVIDITKEMDTLQGDDLGQSVQRRLRGSMEGEPSAILIALSNDSTKVKQRIDLTEFIRHDSYPIGTLPGANSQLLANAAIDSWSQIRKRASDLNWALIGESSLDIETGSADAPHRLTVFLSDRHLPYTSLGEVLPGRIGNAFPAECFVIPALSGTSGSIVVDGAIHNFVVPKGDPLIWEIQDGQLLKAVHAKSGDPCDALEAMLASNDKKIRDNNAKIGELGIGLNPMISGISGIPLIDEKILGTCHLALGRNDLFGGPISAAVHLDSTITASRVTLGNLVILDKNEWQLPDLWKSQSENWFRNKLKIAFRQWRKLQMPDPPFWEKDTTDGSTLLRLTLFKSHNLLLKFEMDPDLADQWIREEAEKQDGSEE